MFDNVWDGQVSLVYFTFFKGHGASWLLLQVLFSLIIPNIAKHCLHVCMLPPTQKNESVVMLVKQRNLSWPRSATGPQ